MGQSLPTQVHELADLLEQPNKAEEQINSIWELLADDRETIDSKKAKEFFKAIYNELFIEEESPGFFTATSSISREPKPQAPLEGLDDTIELWFSIFDEDQDGALSKTEFRQAVMLFDENYRANYLPHKGATIKLDIIVIKKVTLQDWPKPVEFTVVYKDQSKTTLMGTLEKNVQTWFPNFVFYVEQQHQQHQEGETPQLSTSLKRFEKKQTFKFTTRQPSSIFPEISTTTNSSSFFSIGSSIRESEDEIYSWEIPLNELFSKLKPDSGGYIFEGTIPHENKNYKIEFEREAWTDNENHKHPEQARDDDMDTHSLLIWKALHASLSDQKKKTEKRKKKGTSQLPIPRAKSLSETLKVFQTQNFHLTVPTEDDTVKNADALTLPFIKMMGYLPLVDLRKQWASRSEAIEILGIIGGDVIPKPIDGTWHDRTSDKAMTRFFFQGIASSLVQKSPTGFTVDLDSMQQYQVRPGFMPFQGIANFDKDLSLTSIFLQKKEIKPSDPNWEFAKFVIRSSAFVTCTLKEHALQTHFIWSNSMVQAGRTALGTSHPIRRLINPHLFHAANANEFGVYLLLNEKGMFHRGSSFAYHGLTSISKDYFEDYKYTPFPEKLKQQGIIDLQTPYVQDGLQLYKLISIFITKFIKHYITEDDLGSSEMVEFWKILRNAIPNGIPELSIESLVNIITEFVWQVSAYHTLTGDVVNYVSDPACIDTKLVKGQTLATRQTTFQLMIVAATTGAEMPVFLDSCFDNHFLDDDGKLIFVEFQEELRRLSNEIEVKNQSRPPFNSFNPKYVMLSTGI